MSRARAAWGVAGLLAVILATHALCLSRGLMLDDHAHVRQLRAADWTLAGLSDACRLELVGGVIDLWWLPDVTLRFFRPVAFGLMKLTYTLSGWSPTALHAASLAWHAAACLLAWRLMLRLGVAVGPAWLAAALFAAHPGHVGTVQWIACQSELMVTTFLLAAALAHLSFQAAPPGRGRLPAAAAVALFALALGCRENAIMLPGVLLIGDALARRDLRKGLPVFVAMAVVAVAYLLLRSATLGGAALPPKPYVIPPSDPEFLGFVVGKAAYYLLGEYWCVPCVPLGGLAYFRSQPLLFAALVAAVLALWALLLVGRVSRGMALQGIVWMLLFMAPVLPAFESPHHLYLPGVGWAMTVASALTALAGGGRGRRALGVVVAGLHIALFGTLSYFSGFAMGLGRQVEESIVRELRQAPRPVRSGDTLYVANLPVVAHYLKLFVEDGLGVRDVRVVGLTWAPRLLGMTSSSELRVIDDRTIEIHGVEPYFAGPLGELCRAAGGGRDPLGPDRGATHADFDVQWHSGGSDGPTGLRFRFREPLAREGVHVLWGSQTRWAAQMPWELLRAAPGE
jgi:hypothetical protein